ncbi:MAG: ThuA domain-containing protein [Acidobacteria bacterium]|nr:ThuA domain-containing protein [Acidobacteriota bacterium]
MKLLAVVSKCGNPPGPGPGLGRAVLSVSRLFSRLSWLRAAALLLLTLAPAPAAHVVFVTGDDEYRSEYSMPMIARILETRHGMRTSVAYARPTPQAKNNIEGLAALKTADLAVFFLRWRELPDDQMKLILDYLESGKPIVGLRTATHSFLYPKGHRYEGWNQGFGLEVFGQRWIRHHGATSSTDVSVIPEWDGHPILRGVERSFHARSWLYVVEPLQGACVPLLEGRAVNPGGLDLSPQPVAWTKFYKGARVFFTTLGHPEDFRVPSVRRLLVNGIYWALGQEAPKQGADVELPASYDPPAAGVP